MAQQLTLGTLNLLGGTGTGYTLVTVSQGTDWGNPDPIEVAVRSLLQDGSIVVTQGHDNRTVTLRVKVRAATAAGLAQGEADLFAQVGIRNTLAWTPPKGSAATTVFDVITSSLEHDLDDLAEARAMGERTYALRLVCAPFGRSASTVTVAALATPPASPTNVTISTGSATTGWTAVGGTLSVVSDAVQVSSATLVQQELTYTASIDVSTTRYIVVDLKTDTGAMPPLWFNNKATAVRALAVVVSPLNSAFNRVTYAVPSTYTSTISNFTVAPNTTTKLLQIDNVYRTDTVPTIGTGRQQVRTISVTGSARTQGSLQLSHTTAALGDTLVYTNTDDGSGYQPACRQYRSSGAAPTADSTTISGSYSSIAAFAEAYQIPANRLPAGNYTIVTRLKGTVAGSVQLTVASNTLVGTNALNNVVAYPTVALTTSWAMYEVGRISLPTVALPTGATSKVVVYLAGSNTLIDETWLFNTDIGALTWVQCGTGTPADGADSSSLWIDTATLEWPRPAIWVGTTAKTAARHALGTDIRSFGTHYFEPGTVNVFTVTSNATYPAVSLSYYPRWQTHAVS